MTVWSNFFQYPIDLIIRSPQLLQIANSVSKSHWSVAIRIPELFVIKNIPSRKANTKLTVSRHEKRKCRIKMLGYYKDLITKWQFTSSRRDVLPRDYTKTMQTN